MAKKKPKKLTPHQKAVRAANRNPVYDPSRQLSGYNLKRAAESLTNAELSPQISALGQQRSDATRQGKALVSRADQLYRDMATREATSLAQQKALQTRMGGLVQAASDESRGKIDQAAQSADESIARSTQQTGVETGARQDLAREIANVRSNQAQDTGRAKELSSLTGQNYAGLSGAMGQARQLQGGEAKTQLLNRLHNTQLGLNRQIAGLRGQRGTLNLKNLTTLRQSAFENKATIAGLGLKEADISARAANERANRRLAKAKLKDARAQNRRQARLAKARVKATRRGQTLGHRDRVRGQNLSHKDRVRGQNISRAKGGGRGRGAKESQSSHNLKLSIDNAISSVRTYRARGLSGPQISRRARNKKIPPVVLNAARDIVYLGHLSGPNIAALRRAGVRIPKAWLRKGRKPKKKAGARRFRGLSISGSV